MPSNLPYTAFNKLSDAVERRGLEITVTNVKRHLRIEVRRNGQVIDSQPVNIRGVQVSAYALYRRMKRDRLID